MFRLTTLADLAHMPADTLIDVRSPAEFAEDHLPGAINLPVLSDAERAEVGTIYKQVSPFTARKRGAALVFRNAAHHIETALTDHDGAWRPLVYCWRGGQRSGAMTWMLQEIGWRAEQLSGGYKSFRRLVVDALYHRDVALPFVLLSGYTGVAKTALLGRLAAAGHQVIDLEGLARHRGSLLGDIGEPQPSQKAFETHLAMALARLDPTRPVFVEAESSKIGRILLPPTMWSAMQAAPRIEICAPVDARADYLARAYSDVLADGARLRERLSPLQEVRGADVISGWFDLIEAGDKVALCRSLVEQHYDPAYRRALKREDRTAAYRVDLEGFSETCLAGTAVDIARLAYEITTSPTAPVSRPITAAS